MSKSGRETVETLAHWCEQEAAHILRFVPPVGGAVDKASKLRQSAEALRTLLGELDRAHRRFADLQASGRPKLTPEIVRHVRSIQNPNCAALARKYGVDDHTMRAALKGLTWKHV